MGTLHIKLPADFKQRCRAYILARTKPKHPQIKTPEEQVNDAIWWVLQKIRKEELLQEKGKQVEITFQSRPLVIGTGLPPIEVRQKVLLKVQELGGIRIINDASYDDTYGVDFVYVIETIQPKFDELYEKYRELTLPQQSKPTTSIVIQQNTFEKELKTQQKIFNDLGSKLVAQIQHVPIAELNKFSQQVSEHLGPIKTALDGVRQAQKIAEPFVKNQHIRELNDKLRALKLYSDIYSNPSQNTLSVSSANNIRSEIGVQTVSELRDIKLLMQKLLEKNGQINGPTEKQSGDGFLKSIHLLVNQLGREDIIFMVLDGQFSMPVRFGGKNRDGQSTAIKKLYNIAYFASAPNKRVDYDENTADNINNGLFKNKQIKKYMGTNRLKKPTLVKKSEDGQILVLKNEIEIKTGLIKNEVPSQFQYLYIDKTK